MSIVNFTKYAGTSVSNPAGGSNIVSLFFDSIESVVSTKDENGVLRGVDGTMFAIVEAGDFALLTTSGVQSCFPTTKDVWTLKASTTYFFEGQYFITKTTTTVTVAMAFAASGLTVTSFNYFACAFNAAADTTTATNAMTYVDQIATTVINATSTAATAIWFRGIIRVNATGTLTPQINFSANTTVPVMKANSFIRFTPSGTSTTNTQGNVA